jgi:hypothetical protein
MCDSSVLLESKNAMFDDFDEVYFDDDEEDSLFDGDFFGDEIWETDAYESKLDKHASLDLSLEQAKACSGCTDSLSEINELSELLELMDDPKEINDIKARIRGKRLQFLMGLQREKILREDLLQLILLFEKSEDKSDEILDEIFTHEQFLDEFCSLQLERGIGFRERESASSLARVRSAS